MHTHTHTHVIHTHVDTHTHTRGEGGIGERGEDCGETEKGIKTVRVDACYHPFPP
jgi:hypothetical protein